VGVPFSLFGCIPFAPRLFRGGPPFTSQSAGGVNEYGSDTQGVPPHWQVCFLIGASSPMEILCFSKGDSVTWLVVASAFFQYRASDERLQFLGLEGPSPPIFLTFPQSSTTGPSSGFPFIGSVRLESGERVSPFPHCE